MARLLLFGRLSFHTAEFVAVHHLEAMAAACDVSGVVAHAVGDEDSMIGFQVVSYKKHAMRPRVSPQLAMPEEKVNVCDNEVPWLTIVGPRRKVRKIYQARKGGKVMNFKGLGFYVFGSYGPDGLEL